MRELSARGRGAVSVLELSGPAALARLCTLAPSARLEPGRIELVALRDAAGGLLDQALVLMDSPEHAELHLHGAPALVRRMLAELGAGEPAEAAGSLEARAEARLAEAASEAAARVLLDQAQGALRRELSELLELAAAESVRRARALARRGRTALALCRPPRVVLAGPVNAGKSTLFNLLVGRERVVVDPAPGTTRDAVRERVLLGAYAADLFDTAGERTGGAGAGEVERAGQELAAELCRQADLVLWLAPPGSPPPRAPDARTRVLASRADELVAGAPVPGPRLTALAEPERARQVVEQALLEVLELPAEPWLPGQGVPFEPEWVEALAHLPERDLRRCVRAWLEPD